MCEDYRVDVADDDADLEMTGSGGVPADQHSRYGRDAVRDREAALALGVRVAIHDSRQIDRNPVIWQPGQDYRVANAIQAARHQPTRTRWGPKRTGPER